MINGIEVITVPSINQKTSLLSDGHSVPWSGTDAIPHFLAADILSIAIAGAKIMAITGMDTCHLAMSSTLRTTCSLYH